MPESFGARLQRQREERQIALPTIAEQTKIKLSLLEGLERDDVSHWPSGIFRRAFVRAYAVAIGLDPDVIVREFLEVHPEPSIDIAAIAAVAAGVDDGWPPTRLRAIVGSAIESLSRLRRGPVGEEPVGAGAPARRMETADLDLRETAHSPQEPERVERMPDRRAAHPPSVNPPGVCDPDLVRVAHLCTRLGRVDNAAELRPLLQEAANVLDASGVILWVWDAPAAELRPALVHGYSDRVIAQLPTVRRDADNATAAAFRSAQTCAIGGRDHGSAALAVPMLAPEGCAGVLALELRPGAEQTPSVRAVASILAALLAQLMGGEKPADIRPQPDMTVFPVHDLTTPARRAKVRARRT